MKESRYKGVKGNLSKIRTFIPDKLKRIGLTDSQILSVEEIFNPILDCAVVVLYFEDTPAYESAFFDIISHMTGLVDPNHDDAAYLYEKLRVKKFIEQ